MHKIIFGINGLEYCIQKETPWKCIFNKYRAVFQNSVGKMLNTDTSHFFDNAKENNLEEILNTLKEFEERKDEIDEILNKAGHICPFQGEYSVYILPAPFDWVITQYSQDLGLFILLTRGDGSMVKFSQFPIYLPHEYAHVVRLHSVLIPEGISSPHQMSFSSLCIFEGIGVLFSAYFNNDLKKENIWKYIPVEQNKWKEHVNKEKEYIEIFKKRAKEKLSEDEIVELYGPERLGYIIGSLAAFSLVEKGYSLCTIDKMSDREILELL